MSLDIPDDAYGAAELAANAEVVTGSEWHAPIRAAVEAAVPLAVAVELDRLADNLRTEAADPNNGWLKNETYRASKIHAALKARARELRGGTHD